VRYQREASDNGGNFAWFPTGGDPELLLLLILLVILLFAAVPAWPYSRGWGYYPSGGLGLVLLILVLLLLTGRI
jgi:hypothetical protein